MVWTWRRRSCTRCPPSGRSARCELWAPWPRTGDTRSCVGRDTQHPQLDSSASGIRTPTRPLRCAYRSGRAFAPAPASPSCSVLASGWLRPSRQSLGSLAGTLTPSRGPSEPRSPRVKIPPVHRALDPFHALKTVAPGPCTAQRCRGANFWRAAAGTRRRRFVESPSFCPTIPDSLSRAGNVHCPTP